MLMFQFPSNRYAINIWNRVTNVNQCSNNDLLMHIDFKLELKFELIFGQKVLIKQCAMSYIYVTRAGLIALFCSFNNLYMYIFAQCGGVLSIKLYEHFKYNIHKYIGNFILLAIKEFGYNCVASIQ